MGNHLDLFLESMGQGKHLCPMLSRCGTSEVWMNLSHLLWDVNPEAQNYMWRCIWIESALFSMETNKENRCTI